MHAPQLPHLAADPGLDVAPVERDGEAGHGLSGGLGEVGEAFESLEGEVADMAELVSGPGEQLGEGQLAAEEIEVGEVALGAAADDGGDLHQAQVDGGGDGQAREVLER